MKRTLTIAGRFALTGVAAAALALASPAAWSLGLGRLQVQSALGETLRAEIDVTSLAPEEASNLRVRIAPPESYRAAGVEYNAALAGARAELLRRPDGRPYLKLSSDRGVQEPFVDVILEITWATGKLVREYTLLFDPPVTARAAPAPATAPAIAAAPPSAPAPVPAPAPTIAAAAPPAPALTSPPAPPAPRAFERRPAPPVRVAAEPAAPREPREPREARTAPRPAPPPTAAAAPGAAGGEYRVRNGDSLSRIAARTQRAGVSLDQMLVALYRGNPNAFIDNNMNLLKAGVVLSVPRADSVNGVTPAEARQVIQAQSADFGAYRQRLASGVPAARAAGSARQAGGKVQASVDDRQPGAAPAPDKLTLSKGAVAGKAGAAEDQISKDRAKRADDLRVAELAKNVDELKRLSGAAASAAVPNAATPAAAPGTPPPIAVAPAPAPVPAPATAPAPAPMAATTAPTPAPAAASSALPALPPAPVAVATAPSAPAPRPAAVPAAATRPTPGAAPAESPGMLGSLLNDNPAALGLGALALALLAAFGIYRFAKRAKTDSGETSFLESRLQPDSFFGASGGQRIDTRDAGGASSSMSYSLSQLDAIGDVDPVAEADVYLAYGRDLQAEEILKEAMRSNPDRLAIRTKLLEVYAKRRDTKGFELLATQLYALTRGQGDDWKRAQELGAPIDPDNALYKPGGTPPTIAVREGGRMVEPLGATTMPQSVLPTPSDFGKIPGIVPGAVAAAAAAGGSAQDLDLDLDDPDAGSPTLPPSLDVTQPFERGDAGSHLLDFTLPDVPELQPRAGAAPAAEPSMFDLSDISLDLDLPETIPVPEPAPRRGSDSADIGTLALDASPDDDPLARKLELAEEFRQIGDADGARELLQEVVAKSSGALRSRAQNMLADLG